MTTRCDQCRGPLYPVDVICNATVCVECVRRPLDMALAEALRRKDQGQARASSARPDERARVEAAIRKLAATHEPFSANDARSLHGVRGGVVGAAFTALHKGGVIRPVGDETSTDSGTHGHRIYRWVGVAA